MSKVIDLTNDDGDLVILGNSVVLPAPNADGPQPPLDGSIRFNTISGRVEFALGGIWSELGTEGSSGGSAAPVTLSSIVGLNSALNGKADMVHNHSIGSIDGLIPALDSKSDNGHVHSKDNIIDLQPVIDGLQTSIDSKANSSHNHTVEAVVGLQGILDGKANDVHSHVVSDVSGLSDIINDLRREKFSYSLPASPPTNYKFLWTLSSSMTFPANLDGSVGAVLTNPSAQYDIVIEKGAAPFGTISISATGQITFQTTNGLVSDVAAGETLVFTCPTEDPSIQYPSITIVGVSNG